MESSMSPYPPSSKQAAFSITSSYPSPAHSDAHLLHRNSDQGLGLYDCSVPAPPQSTVSVLPPSPQSSEVWSRPGLSESLQRTSSQAQPDIFSAAYDPFASFHTPPPAFGDSSNFSSSPSTAPELTSSPSASGGTSAAMSTRSSFSSFSAPDHFAQRRLDPHMHAKVKAEESHNEWLANHHGEPHLNGNLNAHEFMSVSHTPFSASLEAQSLDGSVEWSSYQSRSDHGRYDSEPFPGYGEQEGKRSSDGVITNVARTRKRRQLTTPADANHECRICGKLFGRSYNFKAHMETHDPTRVYAHPCPEENCGKKFVRKTDLTRHHQSVHMKQRNYQCELCGNLFARKDTLRRHTEDGCSKRFEISSKTMRSTEERLDVPSAMPLRTSAGVVPMPLRQAHGNLSYSSSPASEAGLPSLSQVGIFGKQDYAGPNPAYCW